MADPVSTSPLADHRAAPAAAPRRVPPVAARQPVPADALEEAVALPAKRIDRPLFGKRRKQLELTATRPGYVPRWINDEPGRIDYAKECGYEHIKDEKNKPVSRVVDRRSGMKAYAMEIPKEFYDEAFFEKQRRNDEIDQAIMSKPVGDGGYRGGDQGSGAPQSRAQVFRGRASTE